MGIDEARNACANDAYRLVKHIWSGHGDYVYWIPQSCHDSLLYSSGPDQAPGDLVMGVLEGRYLGHCVINF